MKRTRFFLLLGTIWFCAAVQLSARENKIESGKERTSRSFQDKWGNHPIVVRQQYSNPRIKGTFPSSRTAEKCAERFYTTLAYLPEELIRKTRLKYVTFLNYVRHNGKYAGGLASGDTIYLPVNFSAKTVFHEFFHTFDPRRQDKNWTKLNEEKFIYSGNRFYEVNLDGKERRQVKKNKRNDEITGGFVSEYAMSFEHEDRAETFAYMIVEGKDFLKRTKNPVMKAKMEYIMELFIQRDLLDEAFWEKHFDSKFKLKNRFYSPGETHSPVSDRK